MALGAVAPTVIRAPETEKALMAGGYEGLKRARMRCARRCGPSTTCARPGVPAGDGRGPAGARVRTLAEA